MTPDEWILLLLPGALLLLLAWASSRQYDTWNAPSAFFALYWGVTLTARCVLAPTFYFWPGAAWLILFFAWCVHVGGLLGWEAGGHEPKMLSDDSIPPRYRLRWGREILVVCSAIGFLNVVVDLYQHGYGLSSLLDAETIVRIAHEFSVERYQEGVVPRPLVSGFLLVFLFLGPLFAGVWLATSAGRRERFLALVTFVPIILQSLIQTTRSGLLYSVFFCLAAYWSTRILMGELVRFWSSGHLVRAFMLVVVLVGAYLGLQVLRDQLTVEEISIALDKAMAAALGSPSVFSQWLEREWWNVSPPSWGAYNLAGVFDLLGITARPGGLYPEDLPLTPEEFMSSNIYTWFRGWVQDFTLPGAAVAICGFGAVAGFAHRRVSSGAVSWLPWLALSYACILGSSIVNVLIYNSILLAWLVFWMCVSPSGLGLLRAVPSDAK